MFLIPAVALQVLLIKVPLVPGATVPTTIPLLRSPSIFVRRGVVATAGGRPALLVRRLCVASNKVFWYLKHPKAQLSDLEKKIVLPNIRYWETKIALFESYFCLDLNLHENRSRTKSENGSREIALAIRIL